jgi:hypothetical protein
MVGFLSLLFFSCSLLGLGESTEPGKSQATSAGDKVAAEAALQGTVKKGKRGSRKAPSEGKKAATPTPTIMIFGRPGARIDVHASLHVSFDDAAMLNDVYGPVVHVVRPGTTGLFVEPVQGVSNGDTLNVRNGRSHKARKVAELPPGGEVWVSSEHTSGGAGCEDMTGADRWWLVRTPHGVEGFVNCRFVE